MQTFLFFVAIASLLPITVALWHFKNLNTVCRIFMCFLIFGILVDFKEYVPFLKPYKEFLLGCYVLIEVLFYYWLSRKLSKMQWRKGAEIMLVAIWLLLWMYSYSGTFNENGSIGSSVYDVVTAITLSLFTAFALLHLTREEAPLISKPEFWILLGVFTYFTSSSFLFTFISANFRGKIWFIHGLFEYIKVILFAIGFFIAGRSSGVQSTNSNKK